MRRIIPILLASFIAGCSGDTDNELGPPAPSPSPIIPTIGGTYTAPQMWHFEFNSATEQQVFNCTGSLTIGTQIADAFSGSFLIFDTSCGAPFSGVVAAGVYQVASGGVTFDLNFPNNGGNFVTGLNGCTFVSGDRGMTGTLVGTRLEAQARTELDCTPEGRVTQIIRLGGNRP